MTFAPIPDQAWPPEIEHLRHGFAGKLNVYRVMAHSPALLESWQNFRNHIVLNSAISARERELVILRAAHLWKVNYEWTHHVARGKAVGMVDADFTALQRGSSDSRWTDSERALVAAAEDIVKDGFISPPVLSRLTSFFSKAQILDVIATIGLYRTLASLILTFDVPLED